MVHLLLASPKGNQGLRYFPYSGFLALTPVIVTGVVGTRLDVDGKPLRAKSLSVSVRCYESRQGPLNASQSNLLAEYTQVVWSKPDHVDYESIADMEFPFHVTLPVHITGFSTSVFVDYRCVWRVEAVLVHAPIYGIGSCQVKHFELPLIRYDVPPHVPNPLLPLLDLQTTKPKVPRIRYCVYSPTAPIGPRDLVSIPIYLQPLDPDVVVRSATLTVERRILFKENDRSTSQQLSTPVHSRALLASLPPSSTTFSSLSPTIVPGGLPTSTKRKRPSTAPVNPRFAPSSLVFPKVVSDLIAGAESSGRFSNDSNGIWSKVLTFQWPAPKSSSRWAIGESVDSSLVSIKFLVHVKVIVGCSTGIHSIELVEKELLIVSTNEAERQQATSKYAEQGMAAVVSSDLKPRRRSRKEHEGNPLPSRAPSQSVASPAKVRRPHTSAGPRDKSTNLADISHTLPSNIFAPETTDGRASSVFWKRQKATAQSTRKSTEDQMVVRSTTSDSSTSSFDTDSDAVREWEEELVRIEVRSRRLSQLLGFPWKRRRSAAVLSEKQQ
ncbi:hypothetical protein AX15_004962 [Amanita polypyramis BW_CC]|nr:hypothetical protein AX15_004962 [Amanita polypyramis BW_CC]